MRPRSLRWRLSLTYAAIALLTSLVLGGILLGLLSAHFASLDADYLEGVAKRTAASLSAPGAAPLQETLTLTAYATNTRIQAIDAAGRVVADSGPPQDIDQAAVTGGGTGPGRTEPGAPPAPRADVVRSSATLSVGPPAGVPREVSSLRFSEQPASSAGILDSVLTAWLIAAAAAIALAALVGYALASSIARPLTALADASDRMAGGDLTARADVRGSGEVGRLARSFNTMAARTEATVAGLQRFVSDAAHQIGTPLTALRTDLELIEDTTDPADSARLARRALTQEQRLEALGQGLLSLSRLDSAAAPADLQPVDLDQLIRLSADTIAARAEQAGLTVTVNSTGPTKTIADPVRLRAAVENLLDNAVKFTPPDGSIEIGQRVDGREAVVWVADDGPGIAAEDREHVFERFYRSRTTAHHPGSGLGLSIVAAAADSMGARVSLIPTAVGTRVELRLPAPAPAPAN